MFILIRLAPRRGLSHQQGGSAGMDHYRINKVRGRDREVVKKKDILARDHRAALSAAAADPDCPVCDVWHAGRKIGSVD
jgi:hypothetical protein